jgi:divalent metal cation (Fe/Co/Zn/Cd) transporter
MTDVAPDSLERAARVRRGVLLEYITLGYTGLEAVVGFIAGWMAGSVALMAFGVDSAIELISAAALVWRLHNDEPARREFKERQALAVVGASFLALAAYIAYGSANTLLRHDAPEHTIVGIVLVGGAVVLMPVLARAKRSVGSTIGSAALRADAAQSELCGYLSGIAMTGLVLNAALGWWWADPVAALAMIPIILREAVEALRGRQCNCSGGCG